MVSASPWSSAAEPDPASNSTPPNTGTGGLDGRLRATQATASARPSRSTRIFMSVLPQVGLTDRGDGRSNVAKRWELWGVNRWEADRVRLRWVELRLQPPGVVAPP